MKKLFSLLLIPTIAITSNFTFVTQPSLAAEAVILETGKSTTFPTWHAGRNTRLCAQALDGGTEVRVNAGTQEESFKVKKNKTKCIDRSWAGIYIGVTNRGKKLVKVWTS